MSDIPTPETEKVPVAPTVNEAPAEVKEVASEATQEEKVESEEQKRSRGWRRLDRWRQRAIEAETRLKLKEEIPAPKPVVDGEPTRDKYATYEDYLEARAEWRGERAAAKKLEDTFRQREQARVHEQQEAQSREWSSRIDSARDDIEDFDDVCADSDAIVTPAMSQALIESDKGPHIAYFLAKNPQEAERISKLKPSKQAAEIVKLEDKVTRPSKTPSRAPDPINPVSKSKSVDNDLPSDKDDIDTWMKKERARMEKAGIR